MSVLRLRGVSKAFGGVRALIEVGFAVAGGEAVALIGPNGAGKTTCFNIIGGQLAPDAGAVEIDGRNVVGRTPQEIWRIGVGRTFQTALAFASMTVRENVQVALLSHAGRLFDLWRDARRLHRHEADALLARVGLAEQAERPCGVLAYGDVKRLELAVALAHEPRLLLMDEPTAGMGLGERARLMELVVDTARARGVAVLFTEHDMDVVFAHADRIVVLDRGEIIADGPPPAVRADLRVQAAYLGGAPEGERGPSEAGQ